MRRFLIPAVLLVSLSFLPGRALSAWSLGANLGLTVHDRTGAGADNVTIFGIPTQSSVFASLRPGLRIGFAGDAMDHEGYLDLSFDNESSGGESLHALRLGANYQYNFLRSASAHPYVTVGAGIFNEGASDGSSTSATSATFGGGVGVGFPVSDKAGRIRMEVRYDRLQEGKDGTDVVIGEANVYQVTVGFDLWIQ